MTDYEKYIDFLASTTSTQNLSKETIDEKFRLLLSILPNGGKLYKYRSLTGKAFKNAYDSLKKGYMWIGKACELNDDADSLLFGDPLETISKAFEYLYANEIRFFQVLLRKCDIPNLPSCEELEKLPWDEVRQCYNCETQKADLEKTAQLMFKYCGDMSLAQELAKNVAKYTEKSLIRMQSKSVEKIAEICSLNSKMREALHVFSMSESYDLSNLWAYYADSGKGFCIEYDYTRAEKMESDLKGKLLNTQKVEYGNLPVKSDHECLLEKYAFENEDVSLMPFYKSLMKQVLHKEKCWEHEREWRITLGNTDSAVPIDIVSGVIIDERSISSENAQKLIRLCKERNWWVKIRRCSLFQTVHHYEDYTISEESQ